MGLRTWIYECLHGNFSIESLAKPEPILNEVKANIFDKVQAVEGRPNDYIFNGYYIEMAAPRLTASNASGLWIYAIYEYSEEQGKGKQIGMWKVDEGDKEYALMIACNHVDLLILRQANLLGD